jgi:hypothetical protein
VGNISQTAARWKHKVRLMVLTRAPSQPADKTTCSASLVASVHLTQVSHYTLVLQDSDFGELTVLSHFRPGLAHTGSEDRHRDELSLEFTWAQCSNL